MSQLLSSIRVSRLEPAPLHHQLSDALASVIRSGELCPGERIPGEAQLCESLSVSRTTVRTAMQDLVDGGYVVKIQGKGTFVAQRQVKRGGLLLTGFTEDMKTLGKHPTSSMLALHMAVPPAWASQALGLAPFESAVFLARLRLVDDEPLAIHRIWLAPRLGIDLEELRSITSLYSFLREQKGIALVQAEESIQAIAAAPETADLLHIEPGAPILSVGRTTYDLQGQTVETGECLYRGDLYEHYLFTRHGH